MSGGFSFRVPASTSNLGAGFDALSLALQSYLKISLQAGDKSEIVARGVSAELIPTTPDNLILRVAAGVARARNRQLPAFRMTIDNEIPLARGMGSSAAAIIAGITCYELLSEEKLSEQEIFRYAFEFEPHPDNLAAALRGGLVAAAVAADGEVLIAKLTVPAGIRPVVIIPEFELSTEKARGVLPHSYSRKDAVYNIQRSTLTIAALTTGNWAMLREAMRDRIHQPYRAPLIPGLEEILALTTPGLVAVALSGAGPTVLAMAKPADADNVGRAIASVFERHGVKATPHVVHIDNEGRVIETLNAG
ncbi:MAG TPA: homoserine kinase [Terriglobia bacterium]|nr:homoserine kinase [Terriglobia bacterium]